MSGYPNGNRPDSGGGAAGVVLAIILIGLLLIGGLALGGFFFYRVQRMQMMAREAALRAEAMARRDLAEAQEALADADFEESGPGTETTMRQQVEESRMQAEAAMQEAEASRDEAIRAKEELERLKAEIAELDIEPENASSEDAAPAVVESTDLEVHLNAEAGVYIDQEPKDWDQVAKVLDELTEAPRGRVVIVADKECRMEPVLRLMQLAKRRELSVTVSTREFPDSGSE